ncbi:hypothetical protein [Leuconostoc citreum]
MRINKQKIASSVLIIEGITFNLLGLFGMIYEIKMSYISKAIIVTFFIISALIVGKDLIDDTLKRSQSIEIPWPIIIGAIIGLTLLDALLIVLVVLQMLGRLPKMNFPF